MENRIIALVAEHLLNEQFRSKKTNGQCARSPI